MGRATCRRSSGASARTSRRALDRSREGRLLLRPRRLRGAHRALAAAGSIDFTLDPPSFGVDCPVAWSFIGSLVVGGTLGDPLSDGPGATNLLFTGKINDDNGYRFARASFPKPIARSGPFLGLRVDELQAASQPRFRIVSQEDVSFAITLDIVLGRRDLVIRNGQVVSDHVE